MKYKNFNELESIYSKLYRDEKYKEALEILKNIKNFISEEEIKENFYNVMVDTARAYYRCNLYNETLDIIDNNKIVIGGFSGGAHAAIDMALYNGIPIKGAILLCSQKTKSFTEESVKAAVKKKC